MNDYTIEIYAESYSSYDVKAENSELAVMEAMKNFLEENDLESMLTIKTVKRFGEESEDEE